LPTAILRMHQDLRYVSYGGRSAAKVRSRSLKKENRKNKRNYWDKRVILPTLHQTCAATGEESRRDQEAAQANSTRRTLTPTWFGGCWLVCHHMQRRKPELSVQCFYALLVAIFLEIVIRHWNAQDETLHPQEGVCMFFALTCRARANHSPLQRRRCKTATFNLSYEA
jgi:hypothetical protein